MRNRYVDLLRVVSLGVVIAGHWLMVIVEPTATGVRATNTLAVLPGLQPVTWLLQVMPVFFLVGGFSHATAIASVRRRGGGYADFVRSRAGRLLRPTAVFVGLWLAVALAVEAAGHDQGLLRLAMRTVAQPLWFLGVYLGIVALAPPLHRLHRALGRRAWLVPAGLGAAAALVDVLRFAFEVPMVAYLNVAFVWLAVHQLGYLYADARLGRRAAGLLAGLGLAATVALTTAGPYPVSMVGLPGAPVSNMSPPTLALLTHAAWLVGLALLLRAPAARWLERPRVWAAVIRANGAAMTAFLWHLTVLFAVLGGLLALGVAGPPVGSAAWWGLRPLWIAALALLTLAVVSVLRWADRPRRASIGGPGRPGTVAAIGGAVLCTLGVLGLSAVGFGGILAGRTAMLVVVPVTPASAATAVAVGGLLLWLSRGPGVRYGQEGRIVPQF
ncbi:acyltransferase family protein [Dactylosporangium sp. McL0621]|uniref:acyltransferase family protein n=1 Tax=Dactylosporangium sp. McL0621 TaxID=3415678 RepID=UPI003CE948FD